MEASWWERLTEGETGSCSDGWGHAQKIFNLRDPISPSYRKSVLNIHWKDWYRSWNSNTLATWCEELTLWKRPWCWERLKAGEEADDRGWDGWLASPTEWIWVWVGSGGWWWTRKPGMLQSIGSQRVGHDWVTELNCVWSGCYLVYNFIKHKPCQTSVRWLVQRWKLLDAFLSCSNKCRKHWGGLDCCHGLIDFSGSLIH